MDPRTDLPALPRFLASVHLAPRQSAKSLTLWPLLRPAHAGAEPEAVPLAQALEDGCVSLEVTRSDGRPTHVALANRGPDPVLVLFGEDLALERHTLCPAASALVPPRSEVALPVYRTRSAPRRPAPSRAFRALPHQVGFAVARGDRMVALELLGSPRLFAHRFEVLLSFHAGESAEHVGQEPRAPRPAEAHGFDAPEPFLEALLLAQTSARPTPGLGSELWLCGEGVGGCALVAGSPLHLLAFPTRDGSGAA
jgi:hypothetical protein